MKSENVRMPQSSAPAPGAADGKSSHAASLPEWPPFNAQPSVMCFSNKAFAHPDTDERLRRWLRKYGSADLFEVFTGEEGHQFKEPRLFLMALTLIEHIREVESHRKWVEHMEQERQQRKATALSRGAKLKEVDALWQQYTQDIDEVKYDFAHISTEVNETTGYHHEEAKCFLRDRAASAACCCNTRSLTLIAKSMDKATAFAKESWIVDKIVISAIEKVLLKNRGNSKRGTVPISEVYAEIPECRLRGRQEGHTTFGICFIL